MIIPFTFNGVSNTCKLLELFKNKSIPEPSKADLKNNLINKQIIYYFGRYMLKYCSGQKKLAGHGIPI